MRLHVAVEEAAAPQARWDTGRMCWVQLGCWSCADSVSLDTSALAGEACVSQFLSFQGHWCSTSVPAALGRAAASPGSCTGCMVSVLWTLPNFCLTDPPDLWQGVHGGGGDEAGGPARSRESPIHRGKGTLSFGETWKWFLVSPFPL